MRALMAIAITLAAGCGSKKKPEQTGDETPTHTPKKREHTGKPRPQTKLEVTVDGKPVKMVAAFARQNPDGQIEFTLSSSPLGCDEITGDGRWLDDGEVTFGVTESQQLQPDGTLKPMIVSRYYDGMTSQSPTPTTGTGEGKNGVDTTVDVDFEIKGAGSGSKKLTAKGTIEATGCMAKKLPTPMMSSAQPAKITIAGKSFGVGNAMVEPGDHPTLVLTTGTETCKHEQNEKTGEFVLRFSWFKKDDPQVSQISLGGTLLPSSMDQTFDKDAVKFTPAPPTKITQTKVEVNTKIMGYPVEIHGNVVPDVCAK